MLDMQEAVTNLHSIRHDAIFKFKKTHTFNEKSHADMIRHTLTFGLNKLIIITIIIKAIQN